MIEFVYLPSFEYDLQAIWLAVAEHDVTAADLMVSQLETRCLMLRQHPDAGPPRTDIAPDCRHLVEGRYLILYRREPGRVTLVRAPHTRREIAPGVFS